MDNICYGFPLHIFYGKKNDQMILPFTSSFSTNRSLRKACHELYSQLLIERRYYRVLSAPCPVMKSSDRRFPIVEFLPRLICHVATTFRSIMMSNVRGYLIHVVNNALAVMQIQRPDMLLVRKRINKAVSVCKIATSYPLTAFALCWRDGRQSSQEIVSVFFRRMHSQETCSTFRWKWNCNIPMAFCFSNNGSIRR